LEKVKLTRFFYQKVQELGFEVGPPPQLTVAIYRYIPKREDANEFNNQLVKAIKADGRLFVSSTTIDGVFWIRIAVVNFRTHLEHIDRYLDVLKELVDELPGK
jgi:glutamate/tyrosine decarboxylase-like PLP-dependent enzyme